MKPRDQIDQLAKFIMEEFPGEPSQPEEAVETAIRLLREKVTVRPKSMPKPSMPKSKKFDLAKNQQITMELPDPVQSETLYEVSIVPSKKVQLEVTVKLGGQPYYLELGKMRYA